MKTAITTIALLLITLTSFAGNFIHPLDFKGSAREKQALITYIQNHVKETYSAVGMDDPMTLRMMEKEELKSFKELTKIKDRKMLDAVIKKYSSVGMDTYGTILMMYKEQKKASKQTLEW